MNERFWSKVAVGLPDECWLWIAFVEKDGYAKFRVGRKKAMAHRVAYEFSNGPIPLGMTLDHVCHNGIGCSGGSSCPHRRCMNPAHLEPVPGAVNTRRGVNRNRALTHCKHGHEFTPENTYTAWYGGALHRRCQRCHADIQAAYKRRCQQEAAA